MIRFAHIVACSLNGTIGKEGKMPWHLPSDLKHFKRLTSGHIIIMGKKTYLSIGRALPQRLSIVVSRTGCQTEEGVLQAKSLEEAFKLAEDHSAQWSDEVFIIGGGEIYRQTLALVDTVYLTKIDRSIDGDTFYPLDQLGDFIPISEQILESPEKHSFLTLKRRHAP